MPCLLAALAACESSAPTAFDPEGAAADAAALHAAFETPLMQALTFAGAGIDRATGGATDAVSGARSGFADRLFHRLSGATGSRLATGELPPGVVGHTYVYDVGSGGYVVSGSAGAPPAGARFQLYAIDSGTGHPVEPLTPLGYVDVIGAGSSEVRVLVGDAAGILLDYRIASSGTGAGSRIRVEGSASTGAARADFTFDNRIELSGTSSGTMRLGQSVTLPARNVALDCASTLLVRAGLPPELQLDLMLRGPNGDLEVAGAYELGGEGVLEVDVNGASYAEVNVAGSDYTVAGTAAEPLPASAVDLLDRVVTARESGLALFDRLVRPVETLITP